VYILIGYRNSDLCNYRYDFKHYNNETNKLFIKGKEDTMKKLFFVLIYLFIFSIKNCLAWDTDTVHPYITTSTLQKATSLDKFLSDFGLTNERFNSQDSRDFGSYGAEGWILLGSIWEDFGQDHNTTCLLSVGCRRFLNHYFDPVNRVGLNYAGYSGGASPIWGKTGEGVDGPNQWSWNQARYYFYNTLTSQSKAERNKNFALTFRSIGQVIHLLEDASQPSHVRNDPHISPTDSFIGSNIFNPSRLEEWGKLNGRSIDVSAVTAKSLPSFDNYFNGLASITNTNFFSDDTIFKNYALPSADQTDIRDFIFNTPLAIVIDEDGDVSRTIYITKTEGLRSGYKVAHAGYFSLDILSFVGMNIKPIQFEIDDRVAQENAGVLIPLAVEYSAGLLNYFFRGQINMAPDQNSSGQYVIKNASNEYMSGLFSLYYDDTGDNRHHVASWSLSINANSPSSTVTFTLPTYPEPKEKGTYILAFQGTLGNENGAVAGRIVKLCGGETVTIAISGLDAPQNGSQYTATGGTEPYTWSITKGSITQDGIATVSGQCGTATITATDSCGNVGTKDVRMPDGFWLYTGSTTRFYGGVDGTYCQWGFSYLRVSEASDCSYGSGCCAYTITTATTKTVEAYRPPFEIDIGSGYPPCIVRADPDISNNSDTCGDLGSFPLSDNGAFLAWKNHYVWNCL